MTVTSHRKCWLLVAFPLLLAVFALGCGSGDEIHSYTVPKEAAAPAVAAGPTKGAEPTDRMLGAILPAGDRAWFFKVAGPLTAVDMHADAIGNFFRGISVKSGAAKPEWNLPEGWQEEAGTGMRAATIMIPVDAKPLELTVIALPSSGAPDEILSNVNRWREQMSLPPVDRKGLAESTTETKVGDVTMTIVDLRGQFSGGMAAPFAGRGPFSGGLPQAPNNAPGQAQSGELPPGHPPLDDGRATQATPLTFAAPDSWQELPSGGMRKAAFALKDGQREALVTAIDLSAASGPMIADPLENVNRWRREVGLEPLKKEELDGVVQKIEVGGKTGQYVEMIPDAATPAESQTDRATLAAIVPAGEVLWFFKITGNRDLVVDQRDEFKSFIESIQFTPDGGADHGN